MPRRSSAARWAAVVALTALVGAGAARAADPVDARLDGRFTMHGTITRAEHVRGEHKGDRITRAWEFSSNCALGPCDSVVLRRERSAGKVDRLVLDRDGPGQYSGSNRFHFPIRCAGRVHKRGGEAVAKIAVKVTDAELVAGQLTATKVRGTYSNPRRVNHTQCKGRSLGRDGAKYTGDRQ
jgi:hypothetical protein